MKKILLFSIFMFALQFNYGQDNGVQKTGDVTFIRNLKWWYDRGLLESFDRDLDTLSRSIDRMNETLKNYKIAFNAKRNNLANNLSRECNQSANEIEKNIDSIMNASFYKKGKESADSSFLYYYTNKELNDYLESLEAVKREMEYLCKGRSGTEFPNLNAFSSNNFLNAYYYMSESRSLLLAAMDNLQRHYSLGGVADSIARVAHVIDSTSIVISKTSDTTKQNVDLANNTLHIVDSVGLHSDTLLSNSFKPYKSLSAKNTQQINNASKDKISTASNTILIDNRKNWWWRTLIGGVIGGIVAGLVVSSAQ